MAPSITNFILFQIGWFACVLGAAYGYPFAGSSIAIVIIAWHLFRANHWQAEMILLLFSILIGFVWDSFLVYQNWIQYESGQFSENTAPYWIVVMWALFSTTLNYSLSWLKTNISFSILFGAVGGPLAYFAGEQLNALTLVNFNNAMFALAIGWAFLTPLLLTIASHLQNNMSKLRSAL